MTPEKRPEPGTVPHYLNARVDAIEYEGIREVAHMRDTSVSAELRRAIRRYLADWIDQDGVSLLDHLELGDLDAAREFTFAAGTES